MEATLDAGILSPFAAKNAGGFQERTRNLKLLTYRELGKREKDPDLFKIFTNSILGKYRPGYSIDYSVLTDHENKLLKKDNVNILTLVDVDGVVISLAHLQKRFGFKNTLWLASLYKASSELIMWTSRIQPKQGRLANSGSFPFMGANLIKRFERILPTDETEGKRFSIKHKKYGNNGSAISELVNNGLNGRKFDIVYFVGSSKNDRMAAEAYASDPQNTVPMVFFDTGHLII